MPRNKSTGVVGLEVDFDDFYENMFEEENFVPEKRAKEKAEFDSEEVKATAARVEKLNQTFRRAHQHKLVEIDQGPFAAPLLIHLALLEEQLKSESDFPEVALAVLARAWASKKTQNLASIATAEYEGLTGRTCDLKPFRPKPAKARARTRGFRQSMKAEVDERWFQFVPPTPEPPESPPAPGPPDHPALPKAPSARHEDAAEREAAAEKEHARMELGQKLAADLKRTSTLERKAQEADALLQAIKTPPEPEHPTRRSKEDSFLQITAKKTFKSKGAKKPKPSTKPKKLKPIGAKPPSEPASEADNDELPHEAEVHPFSSEEHQDAGEQAMEKLRHALRTLTGGQATKGPGPWRAGKFSKYSSDYAYMGDGRHSESDSDKKGRTTEDEHLWADIIQGKLDISCMSDENLFAALELAWKYVGGVSKAEPWVGGLGPNGTRNEPPPSPC